MKISHFSMNLINGLNWIGEWKAKKIVRAAKEQDPGQTI